MSNSVLLDNFIENKYSNLISYANYVLQGYAMRLYTGEDIAQSAIKSLYNNIQNIPFSLKSSSDFWHYVCGIICKKVQEKYRFLNAQKRKDSQYLTISRNTEDMLAQSPDILCQTADEIEHFIDVLSETSRHQDILQLSILNYTNVEIAQKLNISLRTVYRNLKSIRFQTSLYFLTDDLIQKIFSGISISDIAKNLGIAESYIIKLLSKMLYLWTSEIGVTGEIEYLYQTFIKRSSYETLLQNFSKEMIELYESRLPHLAQTWLDRVHNLWKHEICEYIRNYSEMLSDLTQNVPSTN